MFQILIPLQGWYDACFKQGLAPASELEAANKKLEVTKEEFNKLLANYSMMGETWVQSKKEDEKLIERLKAEVAAERVKSRPLFSRHHSTFGGLAKAMAHPSCVAILKKGSALSVHNSEYEESEPFVADGFLTEIVKSLNSQSDLSMITADECDTLSIAIDEEMQVKYEETDEEEATAAVASTPKGKSSKNASYFIYISPKASVTVDEPLRGKVSQVMKDIAKEQGTPMRTAKYLMKHKHFAIGVDTDDADKVSKCVTAYQANKDVADCTTIRYVPAASWSGLPGAAMKRKRAEHSTPGSTKKRLDTSGYGG